jgi:hypothetical protein
MSAFVSDHKEFIRFVFQGHARFGKKALKLSRPAALDRLVGCDVVKFAARIMRPNQHPGTGRLDVIRMIVGDAGVVNCDPLIRGRNRFNRIELAIVAAEEIAGLQLIDRRPAFALDPERVFAGR